VATVGSGGKAVRSTPLAGQQFIDPFRRMIGQPRQHVGEPSLRVDIIELRGCNKRVDGCSSSAALIGACECPIALEVAEVLA
jgi:hypothetical protein